MNYINCVIRNYYKIKNPTELVGLTALKSFKKNLDKKKLKKYLKVYPKRIQMRVVRTLG